MTALTAAELLAAGAIVETRAKTAPHLHALAERLYAAANRLDPGDKDAAEQLPDQTR